MGLLGGGQGPFPQVPKERVRQSPCIESARSSDPSDLGALEAEPRVGLEDELDASEDGFLVLGGDGADGGTAAFEVRLVVIEAELDVAVQVPIHAHAPG